MLDETGDSATVTLLARSMAMSADRIARILYFLIAAFIFPPLADILIASTTINVFPEAGPVIESFLVEIKKTRILKQEEVHSEVGNRSSNAQNNR